MVEGRHVEIAGDDAPEERSPLEAHAAFFRTEPQGIEKLIASMKLESLTFVLPPASSDHDTWRRAVAGDLARAYSPVRINIAAGAKGAALNQVLTYLRDAPGVTGHYVQAYD
ncbi:MAG: Rossmann fold domain-containing protein [Pseudomonadota bacterium]